MYQMLAVAGMQNPVATPNKSAGGQSIDGKLTTVIGLPKNPRVRLVFLSHSDTRKLVRHLVGKSETRADEGKLKCVQGSAEICVMTIQLPYAGGEDRYPMQDDSYLRSERSESEGFLSTVYSGTPQELEHAKRLAEVVSQPSSVATGDIVSQPSSESSIVRCDRTSAFCVVDNYAWPADTPRGDDGYRAWVMQANDLFDVRISLGVLSGSAGSGAAAAGAPEFLQSVVHKTVPRSGNGQIYSPADIGSSRPKVSDYDGIPAFMHDVSMSFVQFEYSKDVELRIRPSSGMKFDHIDQVVVRPTRIPYQMRREDGGDRGPELVITVPYDVDGRRFSVEFAPDTKFYCTDGDHNYKVCTGRAEDPAVGWEPTNALLIFASPTGVPPAAKTSGESIAAKGVVFRMPPFTAMDSDLLSRDPRWSEAETLLFPPGVYWMRKQGADHLRLGPKMRKVEIPLGAYVKSAIEFTSLAEEVSIVGRGVLSGTDYVYQVGLWGVVGNGLRLSGKGVVGNGLRLSGRARASCRSQCLVVFTLVCFSVVIHDLHFFRGFHAWHMQFAISG